MTIGDRLKRARKKMGLSQLQMAQKVGITKSALAMYEQNKRIPRDETKVKIANFFNVSVVDLFF